MNMNIWEILVAIVTWYMLYVFLIIFFITTCVYFTYRFWRMILPREEYNIFIANAPVIWHQWNLEEEEINIKSTDNNEVKKVHGSNIWKMILIISFWMAIILVWLIIFFDII